MGWILQGQGDGSSQDHLPFLLQILAVCLGPLQLRSSVSSHPAEMGLLCGQLNLTHGSHTHSIYIYTYKECAVLQGRARIWVLAYKQGQDVVNDLCI